MPSQWRDTVWQAGVCSITSLCGPALAGCAEPQPSAEELRRACTSPALSFDTLSQRDTVLGDGTRIRLIPETGSRGLSEKDLAGGRVLAKLKVVPRGDFPELGVRDSACWYAKGNLPERVASTIASFDRGRSYTFATRTHRDTTHAAAAVAWYAPNGKKDGANGPSSTLPVRLASQGAEPWPVARALAWSTCTGGYCCSPIGKPK